MPIGRPQVGGALPELLRRITPMAVLEATEDMAVEITRERIHIPQRPGGGGGCLYFRCHRCPLP